MSKHMRGEFNEVIDFDNNLTFNLKKCLQDQNSALLDLSDEILLMILRELTTQDLINVHRSCRKLKRLTEEKNLWIHIKDPQDDYYSLKLVFGKFLSKKTKSLRVSSKNHGFNRGYRSSLSLSMLSKIIPKAPNTVDLNLTKLYLIRQKIDGKLFSPQFLPNTLKLLHLTGTLMTNVNEESAYFKDLNLKLELLEDLDLTDCTWVSSHALLALSRLNNLTRLGIRGCRDVGNCLAYTSLASRFGFRKLKILDATNTSFGSTELSSLGALPTIEEFYIGQYDTLAENENQYNLITDHCISSLRHSKHLRKIDLSGTRITDLALRILGESAVTNLSQLDAHYTNLSDSAIESFRRLKPGCVVNINRSPVLQG